jgi:nucleoside-diphosphate-sugar epimerase
MAMKVFVAGGTGVLGRASLCPLVEAGYHVLATARGNEKAQIVRDMGAEPVECDLYDPKSVRQAIAACDVLIRLTTKIGSVMNIRDRKAWDETNRLRTEGARILVDAAIAEDVPAYLHESITFVYADGGANWLMEDAPVDDAGTAALRAAIEGEQEAARFSQNGGRGIVLRFAGFYGPDAPSTHEMITMARRRMLNQIGSGTNYLSSIYVPDAGRAVAAAVNAPSGIYNVCDDDPVVLAEELRVIAAAIGAKRPMHLPGFLGGMMFGDVWKYLSRSLRVSNAKLKRGTGWQPQTKSVREGWPLIAATLAAGESDPRAA